MNHARRFVHWLILELVALSRVYTFHHKNSEHEKFVVWAVTTVWLVLEIGTTFSGATPPPSMWWMRLIVAVSVARMLGVERALIEAGGAGIAPRDVDSKGSVDDTESENK